jgi:hypothetical protein
MLITWGKTMESLRWRVLNSLKETSAELHLLDTGHFALEQEVDRIGSLMHELVSSTTGGGRLALQQKSAVC